MPGKDVAFYFANCLLLLVNSFGLFFSLVIAAHCISVHVSRKDMSVFLRGLTYIKMLL